MFLLRRDRRRGGGVALGVRVRELFDLALTCRQLVGVPQFRRNARTLPGGPYPVFLRMGAGELLGRHVTGHLRGGSCLLLAEQGKRLLCGWEIGGGGGKHVGVAGEVRRGPFEPLGGWLGSNR